MSQLFYELLFYEQFDHFEKLHIAMLFLLNINTNGQGLILGL